MMPFASLGMTALADHFGIRTTMMISAGIYAMAGILIFTGPGRYCSELPVAAGDAAVPVAGAA